VLGVQRGKKKKFKTLLGRDKKKKERGKIKKKAFKGGEVKGKN